MTRFFVELTAFWPSALLAQASGGQTSLATTWPIFAMKLHEWGQLFAWAAAALFFGYKLLLGYLITDLSLKVSCERRHKEGDLDYLSVTVTAKKSERGAIKLDDAKARVRGLTPDNPRELFGIHRLERSNPDGQNERALIKWTESSGCLNMAPGDEMQFAALFEVPCGQASVVDVVVLGKIFWRTWRGGSARWGQWRACAISLPHSSLKCQECGASVIIEDNVPRLPYDDEPG